jgi:hypothetical protein
MYSYKESVPAEDRWAIIAYIRALQLSQDTPIAQVPEKNESDPLTSRVRGAIPVKKKT